MHINLIVLNIWFWRSLIIGIISFISLFIFMMFTIYKTSLKEKTFWSLFLIQSCFSIVGSISIFIWVITLVIKLLFAVHIIS